MRTFYSVLVSTLLITNFLTASENMRSDPNTDRSKRRAVTRSMVRPETPRSPLLSLEQNAANTSNPFAEADNSRYRQSASDDMLEDRPLATTPVQVPAVLAIAAPQEHPNTAHNRDWEQTQLPTMHFLAKAMIVDYLLTDCKEIPLEERYRQIQSAHNLFLTCKHWIEFTLDRPISLDGKTNPRWTPIWRPLTQFNGDHKRVAQIRTALPNLVSEITGFEQATATDPIAQSTSSDQLFTHYTGEQVARLIQNFRIQKKDGKRVYLLGNYHKNGSVKGRQYWKNVHRIGKTSATTLKLKSSMILPHNIGKLTNLRTLDISQNDLLELPSSLEQLTSLANLNMSYNSSLRHLPKSLTRLTNLMEINLNYTGSSHEPWNNIVLPRSVTKVSTEHVDFTELQSFKADGVVELNAHQQVEHGISVLLNRLTGFTNLQRLVLGSSAISKLNRSFSDLTTLKSLDLSCSKYSEYHPDVQTLAIGETLPKSLTFLSLPGNMHAHQLNALPSFTKLQILNLSGNQGIPLMPGITDLKELRILKSSTTLFAPNMFENLPNLEFLILACAGSDIPLTSIESIARVLPHYAEVYQSKPELNDTCYMIIMSRKAYPWRDLASRSSLNQIKINFRNSFYLYTTKKLDSIRTNVCQDNTWLENWVSDEKYPTDLFSPEDERL